MAQLFKEELRKEIKAKRKLINIDCQMLVENLMKTQEYKRAKNIMIFYPLKYEVNLLSLLKDKTKSFISLRLMEKICCAALMEKEMNFVYPALRHLNLLQRLVIKI